VNYTDQELIHRTSCNHCMNMTSMILVHTYSRVATIEDEQSGIDWEEGDVYQLLLCMTSDKVSLRQYYYHSGRDEYSTPAVLYPTRSESVAGLPPTISKAYESAIRVSRVDANAYGVLLGRVLELVCHDKSAQGKSLYAMLEDLSSRGDIPVTVLNIAQSLRSLRNVGAHASLGELTEDEVPILDKLCRVILEYVYAAPELVAQAQAHLNSLMDRASKQAQKT
jgi:hypothetical protein